MHPDRGIVRTNRRSDGLSTRPDGPNTLTFQSAGVITTPIGTCFTAPLHGILPVHGPDLCYAYGPSISSNVMIVAYGDTVRSEERRVSP